MISQESTTKDVNLSVMISVVTQGEPLYSRDSLWLSLLQGFSDFFTCFFKVPQVKNRLFPRKPLPLCKPLRFVQFGQESCPGLSSSAKSLVQLGNTFNKRIKRLKLINIESNLKTIVTCCVCLSSLCNKKLQLGNNFVREAEGSR